MNSPLPQPNLLKDPHYDEVLVRAIVDSIRDPLLVLDEELRVLIASSVFYKDFNVEKVDTLGRELRTLGNGQWDIPALRTLLLEVIPEKKVVRNYQVEHTFEHLGSRIMLITAQEVHLENDSKNEKHLLVSINDITESRQQDQETQRLLAEQRLLLQDVRHRMANNLQIIVSILLLKAQASTSEEVRAHLTDTHNRVLSIATLEKHLQPLGVGEYVEIHKYLTVLCKSVTASIISDPMHVELKVEAAEKHVLSSEAVMLGLITTELVMNSIKHAFKGREGGEIVVSFEIYKDAWRLSVADNGVGLAPTQNETGLGSGLIESFARQLQADVERESDATGTKVYITHRLDAR